jgi:adenylate kinase
MTDREKIDSIKKWLATGSINIFGRPFAGKDTQAKKLAELFDGKLLGGGDILRGSVIPERAQEALRTGKLIPSEDYVNIVLPYLEKPEFQSNPLILSSVGRWHGEEDGVINALIQSGHPLKAVIHLNMTDDDSFDRWEAREINNDRQNRHDDTKEILAIRLNEYQQKTIPVIEFYRNNGLLIEIDGCGTRDQVTIDILNALANISG